MKGIILAGGKGTRLLPITSVISKQLLPVYDKPMIYYPLSILMLAGIKEVLIISSERDLPFFKQLLGNGENLGISLNYEVQKEANGIPEAFIIGKDFINNDNVCLILGDNILYGESVPKIIKDAINSNKGATVFIYPVKNPEQYGIIQLNKNNEIISIEEKPENPKSNYAITGLYIFNNYVIEISKKLTKSLRNELEIVDVLKEYHKMNNINVYLFGRGVAWLDSGTYEDLFNASMFIEIIEKRQGLKIACIEEIAYRMGYIDLNKLEILSNKFKNCEYGKYLKNIIELEKGKKC